MGGLARVVTSHPIWVLLALLALTVAALIQVVDPRDGRLRLEVDPSIDSLLPQLDPDRAYYDHVRRIFGSDETILVVVRDADVLSRESLLRIRRLTDRLSQIPGVHHVRSLANAVDVRGGRGEVVVAPFLEDLPASPAEREALARALRANPLYAGSLVADDGTATLLFVHLKDLPERVLLEGGLVEAIDGVVAAEAGEAEVHVTGGLYAKAENARLLLADLRSGLPLAVLVVLGVAGVAFRSLRGIVLPAVTIALPVVWTLAVMSMAGTPLNLMTSILPTLILVVGFAYVVHVVAEYYDVLEGLGDAPFARGHIAFLALRSVALPVVLTGVTTAAGFISLTTSPIRAIQQFGLYATLGVLLTLVSTLVFAPAMLAILPERVRGRGAPARARFERMVEGLARFDMRRRGSILLAGAAVCVLSVALMTRIHVSTHFTEPGGALYEARQILDEHLQGANAFYVVIEADRDGAFERPRHLRALREVQRWLQAQPEVGGVSSLADYVMLLHRAFQGGEAGALEIPDSERLVSQLLFFGASDELEGLVDARRRTAAIQVRSRVDDSASMSDLVARIEARLAELPEPLRGTVTGNTVLVTRTLDDLAVGQALSLGFAFAMILAVLSLLFTSLRAGIVAMIPNALPVLLYFGILGATGITLNTTTGLVACLVLGIAVDDSIHYLARFNSAAKRLADESRAIRETLRSVGRPVGYTSLALCLGFLTLTASHFQNQVQFGALAAVTLAFAWLVDVTFTPAIASRMRIVSLWDVLTLDLGEAPNSSISIFRGMSVYQARIAALMFRLVAYPKGHLIFEAGDAGDHMYVVLDGELRAFLETDRGRVDFGLMKRGDAVGEVALFHGTRTASLVAETDVRLLRFSRRDLARLSRRHARIANILHANLGQVLADHVASTTEHVR